MDTSLRLHLHATSGRLLDTYVGRVIAASHGGEYRTAYDMIPRGINGYIGKTPVQLKTSCAVPRHVLLEHTARGGATGWLFGEALAGVQAITKSSVLMYYMPAAREHAKNVYGEPTRPRRSKEPRCWVTRDGGCGDAFIYLPCSEIPGGMEIEIPRLGELTGLCKTCRNNSLPDDVRLAALDRLSKFVTDGV